MSKKLLYLHGLNSCLHADRQEVLEKYDMEIEAPSLDYEKPELLEEMLRCEISDAIIGSSAGGLLGYYLSYVWKVPALLFNPAMPFRKNIPNLPEVKNRASFAQIVIGAHDEVIPPQESFSLIQSDIDKESPVEIHWRNDMGHPLSIDVFSEECDYFFKKIEGLFFEK